MYVLSNSQGERMKMWTVPIDNGGAPRKRRLYEGTEKGRKKIEGGGKRCEKKWMVQPTAKSRGSQGKPKEESDEARRKGEK